MKNKKIQIVVKTVLPWVILLSVAGVVGTWFLFSKLDAEEKVLEETMQNYSDTMDQLKSFNEIKKTYDSYSGDKDKFQNMTVSKNSTLDLIKELEEAAKLTGVSLKTSVGSKPLAQKTVAVTNSLSSANDNNNSDSSTGKVDEVWLKADIDGSFEKTVQFIKYVENADKIVAITSLSIGQLKTSTPEEMLVNKDGSLGIIHSSLLISNNF